MYDEFQEDFATGSISKTAKFWIIYIDQIRIQMLALTAVQENDLDMLICSRM